MLQCEKPRTAGVEGRRPERGPEDASEAYKKNWERREEPQKALGSTGKAAGQLTFVLTGVGIAVGACSPL